MEWFEQPCRRLSPSSALGSSGPAQVFYSSIVVAVMKDEDNGNATKQAHRRDKKTIKGWQPREMLMF